MFTLNDLFTTLATGELSNIKLGSTGTIVAANYEAMVSHVNMGLLELCKRFTLIRNEVQLQQHADTRRYFLRTAHVGEESELDDYTYLLYDEDAPFTGNLIKVLTIFDEDGDEYPLNDAQAIYPIATPEYDILVMDPPDIVKLLDIVYQASHIPIKYTGEDFDPEKILLKVPATVKEPLIYYIASRIFSGMASTVGEGATTPGMTYSAKYEIACKKLELYNLVPENKDSGQQFIKNGWV